MEEGYRFLAESLKLLSASYDEQKTYLPEADVSDDVVSTFEEAFLVLPRLVEAGLLSNVAIAAILRVYNKLQWSLRNLDVEDFGSEQWNEVRKSAGEALAALGEDISMDDLGYV